MSSNYHHLLWSIHLKFHCMVPFQQFLFQNSSLCTGPAHHGDVTRVEICGSISTSKLGAPDGDVWHRLALWRTISGRFLVLFGAGCSLRFWVVTIFTGCFFPNMLLKMVKKRFWSPDIAFFGGCLNRWDDDFPHSKMTL